MVIKIHIDIMMSCGNNTFNSVDRTRDESAHLTTPSFTVPLMNKTVLHAFAGTLAMVLVASFWTSTVVAEMLLGPAAVVAVKLAIAKYGLVCLAASMAVAGGSGFAISRARTGRLIAQKKRRMPVLGANGLLVMIPAAIYLAVKATAGEFDARFYAVQGIELVVGVVQLTLMGKNFAAGLRLSGRLREKAKR
jgi:hypothetical protein